MEWLFWCAVVWLVYVIVMYPAFLLVLGLRKQPSSPTAPMPSVTMVIAACNEEAHIASKLEGSLQLDFPQDRLEIIVCTDDCTTDRTEEIVADFEAKGVILVKSEESGKNASMDAAVSQASGDVLFFTDVTADLEPSALRRMASWFDDPSVGCVGGRVVFRDQEELGPREERSYWDLENALRRGSSRLEYVPAVPGALHAMRRQVYRPVPNFVTRDLIDPALAVVQGYKCVYDDSAVCEESGWTGTREVFRSRVRVTERSWPAFLLLLQWFASGRLWGKAAQLASHKILRLLLWIPMVIFLVTSLVLGPTMPLAGLLAGLQIVVLGFSLVGLAAALAGRRLPLLSAGGLLLLNIAAVILGTLRSWRGHRSSMWRIRPD